MSGFLYPVDVDDLTSRLKDRGDSTLERLGLRGGERPDQVLTAIVWGVGHGGFPVMANGTTFHGAVDIGLPEVATDDPTSFWGASVTAIADGEVVYAESGTRTAEGFDFGRVILRHQAPDGSDVYTLYQHLGAVIAGRPDRHGRLARRFSPSPLRRGLAGPAGRRLRPGSRGARHGAPAVERRLQPPAREGGRARCGRMAAGS